VTGLLFLNFFYSLKRLVFISSIRDAAWLSASRWIGIRFFWYYIITYSTFWFLARFYWKPYFKSFLLIILALPPSLFFFFKILVWLSLRVLPALALSLSGLLLFFLYWTYFFTFTSTFNYLTLKLLSWKFFLIYLFGPLILTSLL